MSCSMKTRVSWMSSATRGESAPGRRHRGDFAPPRLQPRRWRRSDRRERRRGRRCRPRDRRSSPRGRMSRRRLRRRARPIELKVVVHRERLVGGLSPRARMRRERLRAHFRTVARAHLGREERRARDHRTPFARAAGWLGDVEVGEPRAVLEHELVREQPRARDGHARALALAAEGRHGRDQVRGQVVEESARTGSAQGMSKAARETHRDSRTVSMDEARK